MPVLCWRSWLSAMAHSSRSFADVDSNCNKHGRVDHFHTSRWSIAAMVPRAGEKVVASAEGRYRTEQVNEKKQATEFYEENSVSFALGSGNNFHERAEKDVSENCFSRGMRRGLEQDPVSEEVKINSLILQEDEISCGKEKIFGHDDDYTLQDCTENKRSGSKRHGERLRRRAAILAASSAVLSSMSCLCCSKVLAAGSSGSGLQWDYGGPSGVEKWQGLCAVGPKQSPIDIPLSKARSGESLGELQFDYESSTPTISNPGHGTMQVSFAQSKNILRVGDRNLELLQFHFHSPSEHAFDGERFAMEAHLRTGIPTNSPL